jgi:hypothetical protein
VIQNAVAESAADVTTDGYVQATQTALFAYWNESKTKWRDLRFGQRGCWRFFWVVTLYQLVNITDVLKDEDTAILRNIYNNLRSRYGVTYW